MRLRRTPIANAVTTLYMNIQRTMHAHQPTEFTGTLDRPADQPAANDPAPWGIADQLVAVGARSAETEVEESKQKVRKGEISSASRAGEVEGELEPAGGAEEQDAGPSSVAGATPDGIRLARREACLRSLIGSRVTQGRETLGMSQADCAWHAGFRNGTQLSLWEKGHRLPPLGQLIEVAKVLGVSLDFLCGLSDEPERDPSSVRRAAVVRELHRAAMSGVEVLADRLLAEGSVVEGQVRAVGLCTKAAELAAAVDRLRASNEDVFNEMRGGALVLRLARDAREAADVVGATLDRADRERDYARRAAVDAVRGASVG